MSKVKVSLTYIPKNITEFQLHPIEDDERINESLKDSEEDNISSEIVKVGLANGWTLNSSYKELIKKAQLSDYDNSQILEIFKQWLNQFSKKDSNASLTDFKYSISIQNFSQDLKELIFQKHIEGWQLKTISSAFGIQVIHWRYIINEAKFKINKEKEQK